MDSASPLFSSLPSITSFHILLQAPVFLVSLLIADCWVWLQLGAGPTDTFRPDALVIFLTPSPSPPSEVLRQRQQQAIILVFFPG